MEIALVRHHRKEKRFGPGPQNNYTSGYGTRKAGGGFFSRFRRNKDSDMVDESNRLPEHTLPNQLDNNRQSYGTETTAATHDARGPSADYHKQETGYGFQPAATQGRWHTAPQTNPAPANYRYEDGIYSRA